MTRSRSSASCRTILVGTGHLRRQVRTHQPGTKVVIVTDPITNGIEDKTSPETGTFRGTETTDPLLHLLPRVTPFASTLVTLTAEVTGLRLPSGILSLTLKHLITNTGVPRYMREIGTEKICSHITNSHIKRSRMTVDYRIGSRKMANSQSHIREIADKKTAYNEGRLYSQTRL